MKLPKSQAEITLYKCMAEVMLTVFGTRSRAMSGFRNPTARTPPGPRKSPVIVAKSFIPGELARSIRPQTRYHYASAAPLSFARPRLARDISRKNDHERSRPQA